MSFFKALRATLGVNGPYTLHFAPSQGGIRVWLSQRGNKVSLHPSQLASLQNTLPALLIQTVEGQEILSDGAVRLPYPKARTLAQALAHHIGERFSVESGAIDNLNSIPPPPLFRVVWRWHPGEQTLMRQLEQAETYLGEGWFLSGTQVWQVGETLPAEVIAWLAHAAIPSQRVYAFMIHGLPRLKAAFPCVCDLTVVMDVSFQLEVVTQRALGGRTSAGASSRRRCLAHLL